MNIDPPALPEALLAPASASPDFLPVEEIARLSAAILDTEAVQ